jgi:hypothetical protein
VATVIGSAVVPTLVANAFFMPRHLLPREETVSPVPRPGGIELTPVTASEQAAPFCGAMEGRGE